MGFFFFSDFYQQKETNLEGSIDRKFLKDTEKVDGTFSSVEQSHCK